MDDLLALLEVIYSILGGDPAVVEGASDAESAMSEVASYWDTHGLPTGLSSNTRQTLLNAIDSANALLNAAPPEVDSEAIEDFQAVLADIHSHVPLPGGP